MTMALATIDKLTVQVTKTADGKYDYLQVLSGDQFSVNIVLIANSIQVTDARPKQKALDAARKDQQDAE